MKEADKRASEIIYGQTNGITPGPHFSKPWTLRTMNSKLQVNNIIYKFYLACLDMANYSFQNQCCPRYITHNGHFIEKKTKSVFSLVHRVVRLNQSNKMLILPNYFR